MLPLDSPRWKTFRTYFGAPEDVPRRIASWKESIGRPQEGIRWTNLWDQFLHQGTITDAAYAAVPHVVRELTRVVPRDRFDYLIQLGLIESARQKETAPAIAEELVESYRAAVAEANCLAMGILTLDWAKAEFRYLLSAFASLHGHAPLGDLLFRLDTLCGKCPTCGEWVHPEGVEESGYAGPSE